METVIAPIRIPKDMLPYVETEDQELIFARNAMMLYPMIRNLTISHGRAAEILGVNKLDLIDFYNSIGLPYLNQSKEDLMEELAVYREYKESRK